MKISVIGTGYVGLTTGACLSDMGHEVICADNNEEKISALKSSIIPVYEPRLEELVKSNTKLGRLAFTTDLDYAVKNSEVCFIAVGTPQNEDGSADLQDVFEVAKQIAKSMNGYKVIVDKSTVPVGTAQKVKDIINKITDFDFDVVSNPEFLKQGNAVDDFLLPDRIIIGSDSEKATNIMKNIYMPFFRTNNRIVFMDIKSAELTKYASNAFLATKISFINEMAKLCENVGADIEQVRRGMSTDSRIGNKFLFPGIGYGGSCFPKDVNALIKIGEENNCEMSIAKAVEHVNCRQRELFVQKMTNRFGDNMNGLEFGIWGLSFKPKTDDIRKAPSIDIINFLLKSGAKIKVYDPKAMDNAKVLLKDSVEFCSNSYDTISGVNALVVLTEWNEFRYPDFTKMKTVMKENIIFDGRNLYDMQELKNFDFEYYCIGRYS